MGYVITSRPNSSDLQSGVVCLFCFETTDETAFNASFSDSFGNVEDWECGSKCCGAEVAKGKLFVNRTSYHTARKDHCDKKGNVIIPKGKRYQAIIKKGYYVDPDNGNHTGIFEYSKKLW